VSTPREIIRRDVPADLQASLPDNLNAVLRRVYAARGVDAAVLDMSLTAMIPVSQLDGCEAAAERLVLARSNKQRILVLGDFDADGATATALVISCLRQFGFQGPVYMVPDRFRFGYGLSAAIVAEAQKHAPELIITVDNGVSSHAGVAAANRQGIDVIVTDHHLPGDTLPDASVMVNPNAGGNGFPSKSLAGVGVAFYVMAALGQRLAADGHLEASAARSIVADCLDLVALGTVADLVPLDHNNRILVAQGLSRMRAGGSRPGIRALFEVAGRNIADATAGDLGFSIAPRLNAAGRLTDMSLGIDCLLANNESTARASASRLSKLNNERRALQENMQAEAEQIMRKLKQSRDATEVWTACLFDPGWHQGVVGLVATRIREQLKRPVIAFAPDEDPAWLKGSGRSVTGVHLRDVLAGIDARQPGLIGRFGGHAMAAGLSLAADNLGAFKQAFEAEVARYADQIDDTDRLWSDGGLGPEELGLPLAETLRHAAPWGQAFPEPVFDGRFRLVSQRIVGGCHLKLQLAAEQGDAVIDGIAFNHPELLSGGQGQDVEVAYKLDVNDFRGHRSHQLLVVHIECV
jgi:single-stranded-DNA-specific exonuclease